MGFFRFAVLIACAFGVLACNQTTTTKGGTAAPFIKYRRVVSLSPSSSEIVSMIGYSTVVGKTASCNYPAGKLSKAEVVMRGVKPDYEKIAKIRPDAVLYDHDLISQSDLAKFKEMGIPVLDTGGKDNTIQSFKDALLELGSVAQGEFAMGDYADVVQKEITLARANGSSDMRIAILLPGNGAEHMIAGTESFCAELVRQVGAKPVGPASKMFMPLSAEWLLKEDPDLIIVAGERKSVENDPRLKGLTAMKTGRVPSFDAEMLLRRGARVDKAIKNLSALCVQFRK